MFLELSHTRLAAYQYSKLLILECYRITRDFPDCEKFAMTQQIRRAALSIHLNLSEGASRKFEIERRRFFEIARGSLIEIDTAFDIALSLNYLNNEKLNKLSELIIMTFKLLTGLIGKSDKQN